MTLLGCSAPKVSTVTTYRQIDSLVLRDSIIYVDVPRERIVDVVPVYDTLHLDTSVASATSWVDTATHTLKGDIENKAVPIEYKIQYVERYHVRDSIITQEVPVEVKVIETKYPTSFWIMLTGYAIALFILILKLISKFK